MFSAAAMSSVDSSLLSGATYLTHNVYGEMLNNSDAEQKETRSIEIVTNSIDLKQVPNPTFMNTPYTKILIINVP